MLTCSLSLNSAAVLPTFIVSVLLNFYFCSELQLQGFAIFGVSNPVSNPASPNRTTVNLLTL